MLRLRATDTGDSWPVTLGRFTGTDPDDGTVYDEGSLSVAEPGGPQPEARADLQGRAEDLDCWLWRRPMMQDLRRSGNAQVLSSFDAVIAAGIA